MNDQFEHNLSATLRELSKEAVPVNLSEHALRGARRRVVLTAAAAIAGTAVTIGAVPLAMAANGPGGGSVSPANVRTTAPSNPNSPVPPTSVSNSPVPRRSDSNSPVPTSNPNSPGADLGPEQPGAADLEPQPGAVAQILKYRGASAMASYRVNLCGSSVVL
jgi:hypothetical protein